MKRTKASTSTKTQTSEKIDALCDRVELSREQIFKALARIANGGDVESNITRAFYHCGEIKDCLAMIKNYCNQKN